MKRSLIFLGFTLLVMFFSHHHSSGEEETGKNPYQLLVESQNGYLIGICPDDSNPSFSQITPSLDPGCFIERIGDSVLVSIRNFSSENLPDIQKGNSLLREGETEKAREYYFKALSRDSLESKLYVFIGDTYFEEQQYDEAKRYYEEALKKNPADYQAYRFLADVYRLQGQLEEATDALISALICNMNYDIAWRDLELIGIDQGFQVNRHPFRQRCWMTQLSDTTYQICIDSSASISPEEFTTWTTYIAAKVVWQVEGKFFQEYPDEDQYLLTQKELSDCFYWLVGTWLYFKMENPEISNPLLDFMARVMEDGHIEEYVLLEVLSQIDIHLLLELTFRDNLFPRFRDFFYRYYIVGT